MKRILIIGLLSFMAGSIHADAYLDSLRSLIYCKLSAEELSTEAATWTGQPLAEQLDPKDSLSLLFKDYFMSDHFREAYYRALIPYARENISHQSLYVLLQACHTSIKETKENWKKDPAYKTAQEQYRRAMDSWKHGSKTITGFIVIGGYVSFLKHYYPNQAIRMNDIMGSQNTDTKPVLQQEQPQEQPQVIVREEREIESEKIQMTNNWRVGEKLYFRSRQESVPSPEDGDYLYHTFWNEQRSNCIGEIKSISKEGMLKVNIFERNGNGKGKLIATRNYNNDLQPRGRQTDYYPSGKIKRVCIYGASGKVISVTETDTLGNIVKKIEGRGDNRKEWQYHTNGQLRKEKLGAGPKYIIHCFDKNGQAVRYLEGDLYVFDDGVYVIAGTPPSYPGGIGAVMSYVEKHVVKPDNLKANKNYTTVCSVRVADDGSVDDVRISDGSGNAELDENVVRTLKSMPKWTPGKLTKWKFVQNPKDAKVTVIRKRFVIPVVINKDE